MIWYTVYSENIYPSRSLYKLMLQYVRKFVSTTKLLEFIFLSKSISTQYPNTVWVNKHINSCMNSPTLYAYLINHEQRYRAYISLLYLFHSNKLHTNYKYSQTLLFMHSCIYHTIQHLQTSA